MSDKEIATASGSVHAEAIAKADLAAEGKDLRAIKEKHGDVDEEERRLQPLDAPCAEAFEIVKRFFAEKVRRAPHHGYHHAVRVLVWTQHIAGDSFGCDALIVALLHDLLDHKFHDVTKKDFDFLLDQLLEGTASEAVSNRREGICKAIEAVSFSKEKKKGMRWYEEHLSQDPHWIAVRNCVSDADKLEALGVVGAARCYACAEMFAEEKKRPKDVESLMREVVVHCHEKLFLLGKQYVCTDLGARLAAEKTEELKRILVEHGVNPDVLEAGTA